MFIRGTIATFFLISVVGVFRAQSQSDSSFMLKRFDHRMSFDYLQEFSTAAARYVEQHGSREGTQIAIRYCSHRSLKTAVGQSVIRVKAVLDVFRGYGFEGRDLVFLRDSSCAPSRSIVPMEIWIVNNSGNLPDYCEKYYSDEIEPGVAQPRRKKLSKKHERQRMTGERGSGERGSGVQFSGKGLLNSFRYAAKGEG